MSTGDAFAWKMTSTNRSTTGAPHPTLPLTVSRDGGGRRCDVAGRAEAT